MSDRKRLSREALSRTITRLEEYPKLLWEREPDYAEGLNAAEINRLSGRAIFKTETVKDDGGRVTERWLIVNHPREEDPVRWLTWDAMAGEWYNPRKMERTLRYLREWLEAGATNGKGAQSRRKGAPTKYPKCIKMAIRLLRDPDNTPRKVHRLCRERYGAREPIPEDPDSFMRTVRRHARGKAGHK
jgi:hypothetical protein